VKTVEEKEQVSDPSNFVLFFGPPSSVLRRRRVRKKKGVRFDFMVDKGENGGGPGMWQEGSPKRNVYT